MFRLFLVSLALASSSAIADLADEVRCREIGFSKSIENRDIEAFKTFLDPDARFVGNSVQRGPVDVADWGYPECETLDLEGLRP